METGTCNTYLSSNDDNANDDTALAAMTYVYHATQQVRYYFV